MSSFCIFNENENNNKNEKAKYLTLNEIRLWTEWELGNWEIRLKFVIY